MNVIKSDFGKTKGGEPVDLYMLTNAKGMEVKVINYGGIIVSLKTPDRTGRLDDIVLGFDTLKDYKDKSSCGIWSDY